MADELSDDNFVTIKVCLPCQDDDHDTCYGEQCQCMCTRMDAPSCGCGGEHWSCNYDADADDDDEPEIRQTVCRHCGLDIEGTVGEDDWRDRGGNSTCSRGRCEHCGQGLDGALAVDDCPNNFQSHYPYKHAPVKD